MTHPQNLHAHIAHIRTRAAALKNGDSEAQRHAGELEREAQEIERHLGRHPGGES